MEADEQLATLHPGRKLWKLGTNLQDALEVGEAGRNVP